jgi:hypothetical protein
LNNELPDQKQQLQAAQANIEFMQGKLEKYNVQNEEMEVCLFVTSQAKHFRFIIMFDQK